MKAYKNSVLEYKNLGLFTDYAKMEGREEGRIEEQIRFVRNCYSENMSIKQIAKLTGLTEEKTVSILAN
jgi:predicted transposase/invertase (TIGR01784 family)